jgi:hypothetical protein
MNSSWQELTDLLSPEHKDELAKALLEALVTEKWYYRIEIEIKDHVMHRINVTKGVHLSKSSKRTFVTCKT